ncbi:tobe domain protein [Prolixibacteraceae bacterium JC049]|nr:tobe domain protein [Prolixibacteraceae bacterium JC049]
MVTLISINANMNSFKCQIESIEVSGNLSLVTVFCKGVLLKSIIIETPQSADYLRIGNDINIHFKETEVIISDKELTGISLCNKVEGKVANIELGNLLSKIELETVLGQILVVLPTESLKSLNLTIDSEVYAWVKTTEVMLSAYEY